MADIRHFRDLRTYQLARAAAFEVFKTVEKWPKMERYSMVDQILRSSRSVCSNLAEAWSKRRYEKSFVSKLSDAETEAFETRAWFDLALDCGYIDDSIHRHLDSLYDNIGASIGKMLSQPEVWCRSNVVREPAPDYTST